MLCIQESAHSPIETRRLRWRAEGVRPVKDLRLEPNFEDKWMEIKLFFFGFAKKFSIHHLSFGQNHISHLSPYFHFIATFK